MNLADKILKLIKENNMSQEELAEKLQVSRQAISRWEMSSAMPDAINILQISKLFKVTTDYLLNDDYTNENNVTNNQTGNENGIKKILVGLISLEIMVIIIQFMSVFILQNIVFAFLSFSLFIALIGGFEYAYQKNINNNSTTSMFRIKFYKISAWLGLYFPIRFVIMATMAYYPRAYYSIVLEIIILAAYLIFSLVATIEIEKYLK